MPRTLDDIDAKLDGLTQAMGAVAIGLGGIIHALGEPTRSEVRRFLRAFHDVATDEIVRMLVESMIGDDATHGDDSRAPGAPDPPRR